MGVEELDEDMIFNSYAEMRALEDQAARETKRVRRERQRRANNQKIDRPKTADDSWINSTTSHPPANPDAFVAVTPFEEMEEL